MPWTRRQVKYLLSSGSPLTGVQKTKMKNELHENPAMGHEKKGSRALKKPATQSFGALAPRKRGRPRKNG